MYTTAGKAFYRKREKENNVKMAYAEKAEVSNNHQLNLKAVQGHNVTLIADTGQYALC